MNARLPPLLAVALALPLTGCSHDYDQKFFDYDLQQSRTRAILDAQAAKAAVEDPTLTPAHFDGPRLNGLGRDKIDRLLAHRQATGQVSLYIDLPPAEDDATARADAAAGDVRSYLQTWGVAEEDVQVAIGPGPRSTPATAGLGGMDRLRDKPEGYPVGKSQLLANQK